MPMGCQQLLCFHKYLTLHQIQCINAQVLILSLLVNHMLLEVYVYLMTDMLVIGAYYLFFKSTNVTVALFKTWNMYE